MSFLIDTDICSALLKGNGKVQSRFLLHTGRLNTSIITVAELWVWGFGGNVPSRRESALAQLLLDAPPILVDMDVAQEFGRVQLQLIKQGRRAPNGSPNCCNGIGE
jgi:tRNA(fMet)-specific endonuclease VapC